MFNILRKNIYLRSSSTTIEIIRNVKGTPFYKLVDYNKKELSLDEWHSLCNKPMSVCHELTIKPIINCCFRKKNKFLANSFMAFVKRDYKAGLPMANAYYLRMLTIDKNDKESFIKLYKEVHHSRNNQITKIANYSAKFATFLLPEKVKERNITELKEFLDENTTTNPITDWKRNMSIIYAAKDSSICNIVFTKYLQSICNAKSKLPESAFDMIETYLQLKDVRYNIMEIPNNAPCPNCGSFLEKETMTEQDVEFLKNSFEEEIVKGENIYYKTNPEEWNKFKNFLANYPKVDIVVDGLNASCATKNQNLLSKSAIGQLPGSRVLLIGKKHAHHAIHETGKLTGKKFNIFHVDEDSKDDIFMIYAALYYGLGTLMVSGDFFKDHKKFKNEDTRRKMIVWQKCHQMLPAKRGMLSSCSQLGDHPHFNGKDIFHIPKPNVHLLYPEGTWLCFSL